MQTLGATCPHCNVASASHVFGALQMASEDGKRADRRIFPQLYSLVSCERCGEPFLLIQDQDWLDDNAWDPPTVLWPSARRLSTAIPSSIRRELEEARKCFSVKAYRATAVMVRRTLEGFCADRGSNEKTLHLSLKKLADAKVVDQRLLEWADGLKALGNAGAHFTGEEIKAQDAADALELAEALLDYTYVFTTRYDAFKARRAVKKPSAPPTTT